MSRRSALRPEPPRPTPFGRQAVLVALAAALLSYLAQPAALRPTSPALLEPVLTIDPPRRNRQPRNR